MNKNGKERNHERLKDTRIMGWVVWLPDCTYCTRAGTQHSWLWLKPPLLPSVTMPHPHRRQCGMEGAGPGASSCGSGRFRSLSLRTEVDSGQRRDLCAVGWVRVEASGNAVSKQGGGSGWKVTVVPIPVWQIRR